MEIKIRKLSNLEKSVEEAVKIEKDALVKETKNYREQRLKYVFSMFILRNEKKQLIDDKSTIRLIKKDSEQKCEDLEKNVAKNVKIRLTNLFDGLKKLDEDKVKFSLIKKTSQEKLLKMAIDMNDLNDKLDDKLDISIELFKLIGELKNM